MGQSNIDIDLRHRLELALVERRHGGLGGGESSEMCFRLFETPVIRIWRPVAPRSPLSLGGGKQAIRLVGAFAYHFWMMDITPSRYRNGNQHLHRKSADYRSHIKRKVHAYHVFIQAGVVSQDLFQYLAVVGPKLVWDSFGSWLRTIRPGIPPSEFVVATSLRRMLPDFLLGSSENDSLAKFIADR